MESSRWIPHDVQFKSDPILPTDIEQEEFEFDSDFPPTDIELQVEGRSIHLNKAVLKSHSPVFRTMLESDFKEKDADHLVLEGKKYEDFKEFLLAFYPNRSHSITVGNALQIIPIADEYQVTDVLHRCEKCLVDFCNSIFEKNETSLDVNVILGYILTAEQHNLQRLLTSTTRLCAKYDSALLEQQERIESVSYKTRYNIARKRNALFEEHTLQKIYTNMGYFFSRENIRYRILANSPDNVTISNFPHKIFNLQPANFLDENPNRKRRNDASTGSLLQPV